MRLHQQPTFAPAKGGERDHHFKENMNLSTANTATTRNSEFSSVKRRLNIWDSEVVSASETPEISIHDTLSRATTYKQHQNTVKNTVNPSMTIQKPKATFKEKLQGLLSPKGIALFNKEMPSTIPGNGCKNATSVPVPKNLKRQQNKHAVHFKATKKWSRLLDKIRLWKKHNACYIQRTSVCCFRECPVEDQKVRRISASRAFCKLRVFALRVGFKRVNDDLINWNDPSNNPYGDMSPAQFVALSRAQYKQKQEISKFRVKLNKELDSSKTIENRRSKQITQNRPKNALGSYTKLNAAQIPDLSPPKRVPKKHVQFDNARVYNISTLKPAETRDFKTVKGASRNVSKSFPLPESTFTVSDHGDKVIAEIEKKIPQLCPSEVRQNTFKSLTVTGLRSGPGPGIRSHKTKYLDQTIRAKTLGPKPIPHSLKTIFDPEHESKAISNDLSKSELPATKSIPTKTSSVVVALPEKTAPLNIVKKIVNAITPESQVDSWLHKPKSQLWVSLNMEAVLVPHLNKNTFELKCLSVDLKILCITECENKINEYLSYLRLVVSVEKQESMRFEEVKNNGLLGAPAPAFIGVSKSDVTQDKPSIVSSGPCTAQLSHLRALVQAQDGLMNQCKKKFLAQFDIHDRIETYLKSILENLQVTGEVFVKICTDMGNIDNIDHDYEQRLFKVKEHLEAMKRMDTSAKSSIDTINAGFTESLSNIISGHSNAYDLKEKYMDQFHQLWTKEIGKMTLTPRQLETVIGCASLLNQMDFSDECLHLKAFEVLSQKLDRIKNLYNAVSKARDQLQFTFDQASSQFATYMSESPDYDYDIYNDYMTLTM